METVWQIVRSSSKSNLAKMKHVREIEAASEFYIDYQVNTSVNVKVKIVTIYVDELITNFDGSEGITNKIVMKSSSHQQFYVKTSNTKLLAKFIELQKADGWFKVEGRIKWLCPDKSYISLSSKGLKINETL